MAEDIFNQPLLPIEGAQDFSEAESKERLKRVPKKERKKLCVVREERPSYIQKEDFRQLWSIQRRDKMRALNRKCS